MPYRSPQQLVFTASYDPAQDEYNVTCPLDASAHLHDCLQELGCIGFLYMCGLLKVVNKAGELSQSIRGTCVFTDDGVDLLEWEIVGDPPIPFEDDTDDFPGLTIGTRVRLLFSRVLDYFPSISGEGLYEIERPLTSRARHVRERTILVKELLSDWRATWETRR